MKRKLRIYLETSIISHLDAPDRPDRMEETWLLWEDVLADRYEVVVGAPVVAELERCHEPKQTFMLDELKKAQYIVAAVTDEAKWLADEYIRMGGLTKKSETDAMHIALATLSGCDAIVSWNFSHIVNFRAMTAVDTVNTHERLKPLRIFSPSNLLGGQTDEEHGAQAHE